MIPPHYSDRYVIQRYNKALQIVQHLPANSPFQPTREEKLELYGYYKQVTHGNVDTARPGLFDVVGRAKWDAWKKLEGMERMEARHYYSETLLRAATEAYKRNAGRATAEQIIHAYASMQQQSADHDSEDDDDKSTTDEDIVVQEGGEESSSAEDADAEERAYLMQVQASSAPKRRRRRPLSRQHQQQQRPWYESSGTPTPTPDRLRSYPHVASVEATDMALDSNPWAPASATGGATSTSTQTTPRQRPFRDDNYHGNNDRLRTQSPVQRAALVARISSVQPSPVCSTSSFVTARAAVRVVQASANSNRTTPEQSFVTLGPVTKRALESLQAEVVALNGRIDDLRKALVIKDQRRAAEVPAGMTTSTDDSSNDARTVLHRRSSSSSDDEDDVSTEWRRVIKSAAKHAAVNLLTVTVLFLILCKRGSPITAVITDQMAKLWQSIKQRALSQVIV